MAAEAFVSAIVEQLISVTAHKVQEEVRLVTGVKKEIKKLTSNFQAIQAVLVDAEQRQVKDKVVADWLDKLKDVSYDMEDVLDEWNTGILKLQIEGVENALLPKKKCRPSPMSDAVVINIRKLKLCLLLYTRIYDSGRRRGQDIKKRSLMNGLHNFFGGS